MDIVKSYFLVVIIFGISDWDSLCTRCLGTFSFRFFYWGNSGLWQRIWTADKFRFGWWISVKSYLLVVRFFVLFFIFILGLFLDSLGFFLFEFLRKFRLVAEDWEGWQVQGRMMDIGHRRSNERGLMNSLLLQTLVSTRQVPRLTSEVRRGTNAPKRWGWNCSGLCRLQMLADGRVWYIIGILPV